MRMLGGPRLFQAVYIQRQRYMQGQSNQETHTHTHTRRLWLDRLGASTIGLPPNTSDPSARIVALVPSPGGPIFGEISE